METLSCLNPAKSYFILVMLCPGGQIVIKNLSQSDGLSGFGFAPWVICLTHRPENLLAVIE